MNKFTLRSIVLGFAGVVLMSFNSKEPVEPRAFAEIKRYGTSPESCEVIEFDGANEVENSNGAVTTIYSNNTPVQISGHELTANGAYNDINSAVLLDTHQPDGNYKNFKTPSAAAPRPMGKVLTAGREEVSADNNGSQIEMDFSAMGSITLKGIHVLDITEDEANSKVEMLDASGRVIKTMKLPVTGAYGATRLNTEGTPGVVKLRITFESENGKGGSGAVDVIEFCRS